MDEALRMNLSDALADGLDKQILVGTEGLFTGTKLPNHAAAAVTTYANYRNELGYGRVDGKFAGSVGDLRITMGASTYGHCAGVFRSANAGDRAALEDLMQVTSGVRVSAHVPAATGAHKQDAVIRLGTRRDMVAPIWEGDKPHTGLGYQSRKRPNRRHRCHAARRQNPSRGWLLQAANPARLGGPSDAFNPAVGSGGRG